MSRRDERRPPNIHLLDGIENRGRGGGERRAGNSGVYRKKRKTTKRLVTGNVGTGKIEVALKQESSPSSIPGKKKTKR